MEVASVLHGNHRDEWHKNQGNGGADDAPTAESRVVLQHFLAGGETCADSTTEIGHAENDRFFMFITPKMITSFKNHTWRARDKAVRCTNSPHQL